MGFSATDAAFEGFKVVRRHPMTIVFWALLYIVVTAIGFAVAGPLVISVFSRIEALQTATTAGAEPSLADMQSLMGSYGLLLGLIGPMSIVMGAVLNAGIARSVVRPSEKAFGYLRLGIDEIRVLVVGLVLKLVIFAAFMAGVVVTTALGVLAYTSGVAVLWIAVVLLGVATVGVVVWLMLRFSLAVPIIIAEHRWALFDSFAMTKGRSLTFLGMAIIAGVMGILVAMLGNIVAMPLQLLTGGAGNPLVGLDGKSLSEILQTAWPVITAWIVINSILSALQLAVLYAPFSAAYRDIKGLPHD
jgi:hypothetical protein